MRADPLRYDTFAAQLADMLEDDDAVTGEVLVQDDAVVRASQEPGEPMFALLDRHPTQILSIDLKQVEGAQDCVGMIAVAPDQIEHSETIIVAGDRFAIDQARPSRQRCHGRSGQRKPFSEVVAIASDETNTGGVAPGHDAEAVVLNLVNLVRAARRHFGRGRQARFGKADS